MKYINTKFIALLVISLAPIISYAQMNKDSKIVGTYSGAVLPHNFTVATTGVGPFIYNVSALFTMNISFNSLGFHEGSITRSVYFVNGTRQTMEGDLIVSPFSGVVIDDNNRDAEYTLQTDFQGVGQVTDVTWGVVGKMEYVAKAKGDFFRKVQYKDANSPNGNFSASYTLLASGTASLNGVISDALTAGVEMTRVSTRLNANVTSVPKIRR